MVDDLLRQRLPWAPVLCGNRLQAVAKKLQADPHLHKTVPA